MNGAFDMPNMNSMFTTFNIMFVIVGIFIALVFGFTIALIISPKLRGKMMSKQVKAMKHMVDYSKEDMEDLSATLGNVSVKTKKRILDENEEDLTNISNMEANIKKESIKTKARAVKEGFSDVDTIYCKHCGKKIDMDSTFCKKCGKKQ